jgi:predicted alpha-1,2-mannosidase
MKKILFLLLISNACFAQKDYTKLVNPFIGTGGHGHTYPGATSPFGFVQLSPDTRMADWDGSGGYHYSDSIIYGFSHTHLSGTGVPDYCDILLQPTTGNYEWDNSKYASTFKHASEKAYAGFYAVQLDKYNINVKLTTTTHTGIHQYTYPINTKTGNVIIDLKHRDEVLDSYLEIVDNYTIKGYRYSKSWATNQKLYFVARFNKAIQKKEIYVSDSTTKLLNEKSAIGKAIQAGFSFDVSNGEPLLVQVALSPVSMNGAMRNLVAEYPQTENKNEELNFESALLKNADQWNKELSKIKIESFAENNIDTTFYTALYHTMIVPNIYQDADGQYRGTDDKIHMANEFTNYTVFSLWDTYRAYHPLMSIINKQKTSDWIKSFLQQFKNGGMLPVWELSGSETFCMIGYHSVPVIVDAYKKGIRNFNTNLALEAMLSYSKSNRFGLNEYIASGYISNNNEAESVSKTMEYAYDDWCIAEFARLIGKQEIAIEYYKRSKQYQNLFNPTTNFFQGKLHGAWYNPFYPEEINNFYTEGNAWHYSMAAPQDIGGLIKLYGGKEKFTTHLNNLFTTKSALSGREQADVTGLIGQYAHGNEPSHHMAYLFNYTNTPIQGAYYINKICKEFYTNKPDGLIGNEDCGQMSAWYIWSCLGMYPVNPASNELSIGAPQVKRAVIQLENGKQIEINVTKKDKQSFYPEKIFTNNIQQAIRQIFVSDLIEGAKIKFDLVKESNKIFKTNANMNYADAYKFIAVPYIKNAKNKFEDSINISLNTIGKSEIKYQISNTKESITSVYKTYSKPFTIKEKCFIHFYSTDGINKSKVVTQPFYKLKNDKKIIVLSPVNPMYTAGGNDALLDEIHGTANWRAGEWQSYYGNNFEAVVNFKDKRNITEIRLTFLQDIRSWIWIPRNVKIYGSTDNINFEFIETIENDIDKKDETIRVEVLPSLRIKKPYSYIKIVAENFKEIPAWHIGAGNKAHIFISEVEIN